MLKIGLNEVKQVNCESLGILQRESRVAVVDPEVHGANDQLLGVGGELELGSEGWIGLSSPHSAGKKEKSALIIVKKPSFHLSRCSSKKSTSSDLVPLFHTR